MISVEIEVNCLAYLHLMIDAKFGDDPSANIRSRYNLCMYAFKKNNKNWLTMASASLSLRS